LSVKIQRNLIISVVILTLAILFFSFQETDSDISFNNEKAKEYLVAKLNEIPEIKLNSNGLNNVIDYLDTGSPFNHQATDFFMIDALIEKDKLDISYDELKKLENFTSKEKAGGKIIFLERALNVERFCSSAEKLNLKIQSCSSFSEQPNIIILEDSALFIFALSLDKKSYWLRVWESHSTNF
jgi:hypothetical protein